MKYIEEKLQTPVRGVYDVIVVGGGPAGVGAAITAARNGARTLLIEQYGFLGGMWTAGLVNPFFDTEKKDGLVREIVDILKSRGAWGAFWDICFDIETMKILLDELCAEAGVELLFHTYFAGVSMEGDTIRGIFTQNKDGRGFYDAKVVIDCTGDGDVAAAAGAPYSIGRPEDNAVQQMTTMFMLGNIDYNQIKPDELYILMKKAVENNDTGYCITFNRPYIIKLPTGRYAVVQLTHIPGKSGIDACQLSQAETEGRRMVWDAFRLFKEYIPEFRDVDLIATPVQIGVRESRRIHGEYTLTKEDAINGTFFEDGITTVRFGIDIHQPDSDVQCCVPTKPYQIPYRSLLPLGIRNLLVAGRCISGDHVVFASYRVTGNCLAMGAAAGAAAAMACAENISIREINIVELKEIIR